LCGCVFLLAVCFAPAATPGTHDLIGEFEYVEGHTQPHDRNIQVSVTREANGRLAISFGASHFDGHGAAPDGDGSGETGPDGIFRFTFEDSFSNKGKGTFEYTKRGYILLIEIQDVQDPRCMMFYGERFELKRRSKSSPRQEWNGVIHAAIPGERSQSYPAYIPDTSQPVRAAIIFNNLGLFPGKTHWRALAAEFNCIMINFSTPPRTLNERHH